MMMPPDGLALFFRVLHPTDAGFCELRALPSRTQVFVPIGDIDSVAHFLEQHRHENCYCGIATRRTRMSGRLENCAELYVLFCDVDFKTADEPTVRDRLARFPLRPTLVVHSGAGLHLYWQLKEPFLLPHDTAVATALLRRLACHFNADLASAEVARILRIPGSFNHKYNTPIPVSTVTAEDAWRT
jgi:hypothetical protein